MASTSSFERGVDAHVLIEVGLGRLVLKGDRPSTPGRAMIQAGGLPRGFGWVFRPSSVSRVNRFESYFFLPFIMPIKGSGASWPWNMSPKRDPYKLSSLIGLDSF